MGGVLPQDVRPGWPCHGPRAHPPAAASAEHPGSSEGHPWPSPRIEPSHAEIHEGSVHVIGTTAILLNRIRLDAVVGGNEVTNPFELTEVYVWQDGAWKLGSLSFTRLLDR